MPLASWLGAPARILTRHRGRISTAWPVWRRAAAHLHEFHRGGLAHGCCLALRLDGGVRLNGAPGGGSRGTGTAWCLSCRRRCMDCTGLGAAAGKCSAAVPTSGGNTVSPTLRCRQTGKPRIAGVWLARASLGLSAGPPESSLPSGKSGQTVSRRAEIGLEIEQHFVIALVRV